MLMPWDTATEGKRLCLGAGGLATGVGGSSLACHGPGQPQGTGHTHAHAADLAGSSLSLPVTEPRMLLERDVRVQEADGGSDGDRE